MTIEEAIAHAKEQKEIFGGVHKEFLEVAIEALEKQIPKKSIKVEKKYWSNYNCPNCERILGNTVAVYETNYCDICGQKLDWSADKR